MMQQSAQKHDRNTSQDLFEANRSDVPLNGCLVGPEDEVRKAAAQMEDSKAKGPDKIYPELINLFDEVGLTLLTSLFNAIYKTGEILKDWLRSTFIHVQMNFTAKTGEVYRIISAVRHTLKVTTEFTETKYMVTAKSEVNPEAS